MTGRFADHFSGVSSGYAAFRPSYPEALFDALTDIAPSHALAWDCGAGTGQATVAQALHWFDVDAFHAEAQRVLVPHGIIAEWSYALLDAPSASAVTALINALDR